MLRLPRFVIIKEASNAPFTYARLLHRLCQLQNSLNSVVEALLASLLRRSFDIDHQTLLVRSSTLLPISACMHACGVLMRACMRCINACMHAVYECVHACGICMGACMLCMNACFVCMHPSMHAVYACMRCMYACMHACGVCMHACMRLAVLLFFMHNMIWWLASQLQYTILLSTSTRMERV